MLLRSALHAEAEAAPLGLTPQSILLRRRSRQARLGGRSLALGIAAALLLPLSAFLVVGQTPSVAPRAGYDAVVVRESLDAPVGQDELQGEGSMEVAVVSNTDGYRPVATIPAAAFGNWYVLNHRHHYQVSSAGRLALWTGGKTTFHTYLVDLRSPSATAAAESIDSITLDALGRLWIGGNDDHLTVLDPATGERLRIPLTNVPQRLLAQGFELGPISTDGSAVLVSVHVVDANRNGETHVGVLGIDGRMREGIPDLDWQGARWLSPKAGRLVKCGGRSSGVCSDPGGGPVTSYAVDRAAAVLDASFDTVGAGVWMLTSRPQCRNSSKRSVVLSHMAGASEGTEPSVDQEFAIPLTVPPEGQLHLVGLAPDDSVIAVGTVGDGGSRRTAIIRPGEPSVRVVDGRFAGFVPAGSLDFLATVPGEGGGQATEEPMSTFTCPY
jgi:hypothetical protein